MSEEMRLIRDHEMHSVALDASIAQGLRDADAGRTEPVDTVFDRLEAKYRKLSSNP